MALRLKQPAETKEFYHEQAHQALRNCQQAGYSALFMPEFIDRRINALKEDSVWQNWHTTPSIRATWKTKQGSPVVLYVHRNNYFSNPDNIAEEIAQNRLINGAGAYPEKEFYRFVNLAEKGNKSVFLVPHEKLKNSTSGVISIEEALEHPQTIPFLGGKERTEAYLPRHKEVFGDRIGNYHSDDLGNGPRARLLYVGSNDGGLDGYDSLNGSGRFFGVRSVAPKAHDREKTSPIKVKVPGLEQVLQTVLRTSKLYVSEDSRKNFEKANQRELKRLYKSL